MTCEVPSDPVAPAERPWHARVRRALSGTTIAGLVGLLAIVPARVATADPLCSDCRLSFGVGDTYHYWGRTGGYVLPVTLTWSEGRYELGVFRFTTAQKLYEQQWGCTHVLAEPYWGISASRRWRLVTRPTWRLFFGFGISYKTEEDALNATHWNFASSLGVRLNHIRGRGPEMELALRHWSNAGLRTPNRGQDFFTVTIAF